MYFSLLLTFSAVAATLLGFISVVFTLGRRSEGHINERERAALWALLVSSFAALLLSMLVASLIPTFPGNEIEVWRVGCALAALPHLVGAAKNAREMVKDAGGFPRWAGIPASLIGWSAGSANVVAAIGYLPHHEAATFVMSTLWMLVVTALAFTFLLSTQE